jgi:uncharacterized Zn finger protein
MPERYFGPPQPARRVAGGIRAQGKLKGENWWATRWLEVLEQFYVGGRLQRGRTYARKGQVLSIEVTPGRVEARVQGSRPKPYTVTLRLKPLADWKPIVEAIQNQASYAAQLLNGTMPKDIEQVFEPSGLSLFPRRIDDLVTECSCPDWSNPCKHVAAVFYLLGEEFERDPFLLFRLRGLEREDLLGRLQSDELVFEVEPLSADPHQFWRLPIAPIQLAVIETSRTIPAALVRQLGSFPFWKGETRFIEEMEALYSEAARRASAFL